MSWQQDDGKLSHGKVKPGMIQMMKSITVLCNVERWLLGKDETGAQRLKKARLKGVGGTEQWEVRAYNPRVAEGSV